MTLSLTLLSLTACGILDKVQETKDKIEEVKDAVNGLTHPMVMQGVVLGIEDPDNEVIAEAVARSDLGRGTTISIFLADAAEADQVDDAPIVGATVTVDTGDDVQELDANESGVYEIPAGALAYGDDAVWSFEASVTGEDAPGRLSVVLPPAATLDIPAEWNVGEDLVLDFVGMGFDSALVVVIDGRGAVSWTNQPDSVSDVLGMQPSGEELEELQIPGSRAFPEPGVYAVGVAGMDASDDATVENMNRVLSSVQAGKMRFYALRTVGLPI